MRNHWMRWVVTGAVLVAIASAGYVAWGTTGGPAKAAVAAGTRDARVGASSIAPSPSTASGVPDEVAAGSSAASAASGSGSGSGSASGGYACPMIPADPGATSTGEDVGSATHLFTRTTADGITIRVYRSADVDLCAVPSCGGTARR